MLVAPALALLVVPELHSLPGPVVLAAMGQLVAEPAGEARQEAAWLAPVVVPGPVALLGLADAFAVCGGSRVAVGLGAPSCVVGAAGSAPRLARVCVPFEVR